jgi:hypothetical protein
VRTPSGERSKTTQRKLFSDNGIASEVYEEIRETCMPRTLTTLHCAVIFPLIQTLLGFVALFIGGGGGGHACGRGGGGGGGFQNN